MNSVMHQNFELGKIDPELHEELLNTAQALSPKYSFADEDKPERVLSGYPNPTIIIAAHKILIDAMLPGKMSQGPQCQEDLTPYLRDRLMHVLGMLRPEIERAIPIRWLGEAAVEEGQGEKIDPEAESIRVMKAFLQSLPGVRDFILDDVKAAYEGDPAALSYAEVQLAYPGLLAIVSHRLAHELYGLNVPLVPRIMSEWAHMQTGVDINPGAKIGRSFFIDHATGVVIGETCEIGDRVKIYQGVTLGAKSFPLDEHGKPIKHIKRHPTVEDDVVIYSNSTVLGGNTVIGRGSTVGANVFLMESLADNSLVTFSRPEQLTRRLEK
jgi:serine O-acetyltransferase